MSGKDGKHQHGREKARELLKRHGYNDSAEDKKEVARGVHKHERHMHKGERETKLASGGRGRGRGPSKINVNVITPHIGGGGPPGAGARPPLGPMAATRPVMPPGGGPGLTPGPAAPNPAMMAGRPPMGPGMMNRGGRPKRNNGGKVATSKDTMPAHQGDNDVELANYRRPKANEQQKRGGRAVHLTAGSGSGLGRLEKAKA